MELKDMNWVLSSLLFPKSGKVFFIFRNLSCRMSRLLEKFSLLA